MSEKLRSTISKVAYPAIALLLLLCLLSLTACAVQPAETQPAETQPTQTQPTEPADDYDYPEMKEQLTWEKINSFPIKSSDMTVEEMRKLCVDFFRFTKSALWTPKEDYKYIRNSSGDIDEFFRGTVYGSLPYVGLGTGNIYRLMDYMDEETGAVDVKAAAKVPALFGNQCSIGSYWAWGRVINSVNKEAATPHMYQANGYIRVGPYTYDDNRGKFTEDENTVDICQENGEQIMFQSYAALQPADGLVQFTTAGHVMMCASVPHVEYIAGTDQIDGEKSYLLIIDQHKKWSEGTNESGDTYLYKNYVDRKMTFQKLFDNSYLPFTYAEFLGTDPVEETICTFSHTGSTLTVSELFSSQVNANYGIADLYAVVKDASGKEVYRHAMRAQVGGCKELAFTKIGGNVETWGTLDVSNGDFTVEVIAQLATGERPTVYTGKLVP